MGKLFTHGSLVTRRSAFRGSVLCEVALCGLLLLGAAGSARGQTARAVALRDVVIDGHLDDWPKELERYPIRNHFQVYGPTDIDGEDLDDSDDLSPYFRVAYDPDENLLLVAVEVRDDKVVVGNNHLETDACEIYVHGPGRNSRESPLQYAMVPGGWGSYGAGRGNPGLENGDIGQTRTQGAFSRQGEVTIYEWAVEVFDEFPNRPTPLTPGRTIGFDVVAVDKDRGGTPAWVPWGPPMAAKFSSASRLGTVALLDASGNWSPATAADAAPPGPELAQFDAEMAQFGEKMAQFATGMAALGIEQAQRELESGKWQGYADLEQAQRDLEQARQEIEGERLRLEMLRGSGGRGAMAEVIEDIVDILGAALILLCIGFSIGLVVYMGRRGRRAGVSVPILDELAERLESVEQRLADTQEVMIALSEKYDRLEDRSPKPDRNQQS